MIGSATVSSTVLVTVPTVPAIEAFAIPEIPQALFLTSIYVYRPTEVNLQAQSLLVKKPIEQERFHVRLPLLIQPATPTAASRIVTKNGTSYGGILYKRLFPSFDQTRKRKSAESNPTLLLIDKTGSCTDTLQEVYGPLSGLEADEL